MTRPHANASGPISRIALGLVLGWVVLLLVLFIAIPPRVFTDAGFDSLRFMALVMVVTLPVALVVLADLGLRAQRGLRDENFRMQSALDALRQTRVSQPAPQRPTAPTPAPKPTAPPAPQTKQVTPEPPAPVASALGTIDLIRALNFPDTAEDTEGFAALRAALRDPQARQLVQASQDVLTLLSQDGIYMDDLDAAPANADLWRRFAAGERGAGIADVGGVTDQSALAAVLHRKKSDTIFRDSMLHFLRHFDKMIDSFVPDASDEELLILAQTRSARAFMLLGRAVGTFE
ncbi:hypothetical protein SAMN04488005_3108 [Yoonia tamlensis]|uniref:Uncharacterized protein n=1 Tax=Yoonia tamlensis TaxID=390270 RepID=A0A1I6HYP0_9RHOB|nr:hypothetical protein [Yoonia tamlensis]SFR59330.1 hypothetical protein SAMN04488005_3108 [Yoonia tamlensis]